MLLPDRECLPSLQLAFATTHFCQTYLFLHVPHFAMGGPSDIPDVGPIYYEPFNRPEDIICGESEDEYCATPAARRRRIEAAARRFLNGEIPFIVSAQLLGPFTKESGWQNPWSHGKQLKRLSERRAGETNRTANTRKGCVFNQEEERLSHKSCR